MFYLFVNMLFYYTTFIVLGNRKEDPGPSDKREKGLISKPV